MTSLQSLNSPTVTIGGVTYSVNAGPIADVTLHNSQPAQSTGDALVDDTPAEYLAKLPGGPECWERVREGVSQAGDYGIWVRGGGRGCIASEFDIEYYRNKGISVYRRILPPIPEGYELVAKDSEWRAESNWMISNKGSSQWSLISCYLSIPYKNRRNDRGTRFIRPIAAKPAPAPSSNTPSDSISPSDTPRTDNEEYTYSYCMSHGEEEYTAVSPEFARQLERELNAANDTIAYLQRRLNAYRAKYGEDKEIENSNIVGTL